MCGHIASTEVANSLYLNSKHNSSDITQLGSTVTAGRDLSVQAGRDLSIIASQLEAKRDIALAAPQDLTISSAADEEHSLSRSKKVTRQEDHVSQVASTVTAGGSLAASAGQDITITSSRLAANDEAYLVAGGKLDLLAAQDSDYSLYSKKKKGHFGAKKTKRDEVTQVTNIGSEIKTGADLLLVSGGDQTYQAARLDSGKDLTLNSGGAIAFEGVKDLHQESHEKSNSSLAWTSAKGKGNTDETLRQSELVAKGDVAINAVNGLHIDVKQVNQQTVSQAIDAMVKAGPQLAWLMDPHLRHQGFTALPCRTFPRSGINAPLGQAMSEHKDFSQLRSSCAHYRLPGDPTLLNHSLKYLDFFLNGYGGDTCAKFQRALCR